jgi:uncharacterized membrane protein
VLRPVIAYVATAIVFLGLDVVWLSRALGFYREQMGGLLLEQPRLGYAAGFYAVYVVGIVALVVLPGAAEQSWVRVLWSAALLGLVAYGTYDMTNMAVLKGYSLPLALVDLTWGVVATTVSATAGYLVVRWLAP